MYFITYNKYFHQYQMQTPDDYEKQYLQFNQHYI